jgi:hypothetical protein
MATIKFGEQEYQVPRLKIGQLKRVSKLLMQPDDGTRWADILTIAFERSEPKLPENFDDIEVGFNEIQTAIAAILKDSGMEMKKPDPNAPAPVPIP